MYPRSDMELNPELPAAADFWTPDPRDVDENDGFGNFDNVWAILNVSVEHAWRVFRRDRFFCTLVASLAANEQEFDVLASVAETGSADEVEGITLDQLSALVGHFPEAEELEDLEIGVAGLVYALAAAGMYPAASCRGHADPNAWSKLPVVFFATDRSHAEALQPLVKDTGCGFTAQWSRAGTLAIAAASVEDALALAQRILSNTSRFTSQD
jgi:hypothetical protein